MISYNQIKTRGDGKKEIQCFGLSTDDKPTENIANGSHFVEMDSGLEYYFDEDSSEWLQFPPSSDSP